MQKLSISRPSLRDSRIIDSFGVPYTLRLCEAIERFTADSVARDHHRFRVGGADLRYVVERHVFFALIGDRDLYDRFVAAQSSDPNMTAGKLSETAALIAPFLLAELPTPARARSWSLRAWLNRKAYGRLGEARTNSEGLGGRQPKVLFLVIQPKFVTYLRPVADALSVPFAFLTIDDPPTYEWLGANGFPRVHVELTPESVELTRSLVPIGKHDYLARPFEYFAIRFNAIREAFSELRPECIVVPEGNAPVYELVNRVAGTLATPTLCVQQGWSPIVHCGFRNMSYTRMCVWGQGFAELLAPYSPGQRFVATGNHVLTCRGYHDDPHRDAVAFFLQGGSHLITEAAWASILELIQWTAREFSQSQIRVREHPSTPLSASEIAMIEALPNCRLMPPGNATLDDTLAGCRVAVAVYSTTILEAAATGAIPLILNVSGLSRYHPDIAADGAGIEVHNFEDARSALRRLMDDNQSVDEFAEPLDAVRRRFFGPNRDQALRAIVAQIEDLRRGRVSW